MRVGAASSRDVPPIWITSVVQSMASAVPGDTSGLKQEPIKRKKEKQKLPVEETSPSAAGAHRVSHSVEPKPPRPTVKDKYRVFVSCGDAPAKAFLFSSEDSAGDRLQLLREAFALPPQASIRLCEVNEETVVSLMALTDGQRIELHTDTTPPRMTSLPIASVYLDERSVIRDVEDRFKALVPGQHRNFGDSTGRIYLVPGAAARVRASSKLNVLPERFSTASLALTMNTFCSVIPGGTKTFNMSITANYGVASNQGASPVNDSDIWYMTSFELVIATLEGEELVPFSHAPYNEEQSITVSHTRGWNVSAGGGVSAPSGGGSMNLGWGYHSDTTVQPAAQKHFATTYGFWEKDPNHVDPLANPRPATNMHSSRWEVELTKYLTAERFAFLKRHVHALDIIPPEAFGYKTKEFYSSWIVSKARNARFLIKASLCVRMNSAQSHYINLKQIAVFTVKYQSDGHTIEGMKELTEIDECPLRDNNNNNNNNNNYHVMNELVRADYRDCL